MLVKGNNVEGPISDKVEFCATDRGVACLERSFYIKRSYIWQRKYKNHKLSSTKWNYSYTYEVDILINKMELQMY